MLWRIPNDFQRQLNYSSSLTSPHLVHRSIVAPTVEPTPKQIRPICKGKY